MSANSESMDAMEFSKKPYSRRDKRMFFGLNLHSWEYIMIVFLFGVGAATGAVVLLTRAENKASKEELEKYKVEAGERTATASAEAAKAIESAAKANENNALLQVTAEVLKKETAEANKQAALANERSENARLETERLKKLVIWRSISAEQKNILVKVLSAKKANITLMVVANDPEAFAFGSQLTTVFGAAKWGAFAESASWGNLLPENIILPGPENETVKLLRSAFTAAGIPFTTDGIRDPDARIVFPRAEQPTARVIVGSKLGPFK